MRGPGHTQSIHIFIESLYVAFGNGLRVCTFLLGSFDNFVVNVSEISHANYIKSSVLEIAVNHIENNS